MKKLWVGLFAFCAIALATTSAGADTEDLEWTPGPAAAVATVTDDNESFRTECSHITDSVLRLYFAYFLRLPDNEGWSYWVSTYGRGPNTNLEVISDSFALSAEFQARYGALDNASFVDLIYRNVLNREADPEGRAHWIGALDRGFSRGRVMISFSESEEFVMTTDTSTPQAGYGMWYDTGFQYECGNSLGAPTQITMPRYWSRSGRFDIAFINFTDRPIELNGNLQWPNGFDFIREPFIESWVLEPNTYVFDYNLPAPPHPAMEFSSPQQPTERLYWSVVFYNTAHSDARPGWENTIRFRGL